MKKIMSVLMMSCTLILASCATTDLKVNGVKIEEDLKQPSNAVIGAGIIAVFVVFGIALNQDKDKGKVGGDNSNLPSPQDSFEDCIKSNYPRAYCISLLN